VALHDVDTDGFLRRGERDVLFRVEAKHDIRSTWFVPTAILTRQKENIAFLLESGNEIGWHGHRHDHRDHIKPFADRAVQALSKSGLTESADYPTGMRAPRLLKTKYLFELLERSCPALCYDTSFLQGIAPYNLWLNGRQSNLLEIPTTVPTDIRVHNELSGLPRAEKAEAILRAQIARTDKLIEAGGLISIVTHPEKSLSERPDLLDVYDQYLSYIRSRTDVWFATAGELFRHWTRDLHNGARKPSVAKLPMLCLLYLSLLFQPIRTPLSPGRIMPRAQKAPVAASRTITTNMTAYGAGGRSN
jgi:peptidoglycan/xylan/chitin deacetylase (PgdA/CDA1 family)